MIDSIWSTSQIICNACILCIDYRRKYWINRRTEKVNSLILYRNFFLYSLEIFPSSIVGTHKLQIASSKRNLFVKFAKMRFLTTTKKEKILKTIMIYFKSDLRDKLFLNKLIKASLKITFLMLETKKNYGN